jgi:surface carbohydrate biosynthesis protein (TIGR04326 family)
VALENILWVAVFDAALDQVDTLKVGLFPFENQGWEKALSWAWYRHGHGHLIGVAHSTVRPWDLRYHGDCRAELGEASTSFPETLVFNGRAARSTATLKPSQTTSIAIAEALRFEHLLEAGSARLPSSTDSSIVVLGNHDAESTAHIFSLLAKASERTGPLSVLYRPHPSCTYKPANTSDLSIHWSQAESIGSTLKGCELAICGSHTSASVDALFSGVAVVVVKAQNSLNLSPLLGRSDVDFVSNPDQLSRILITPRQRLTRPPDTDQFFCLDPNMPRWKKLLGDSLAPPKHRDP